MMQAPPVSAIRRKPIQTYQSPSATGRTHAGKTTSQTSTSKTSSNNIIVRASLTPRNLKHAMRPPSLPLYHPNGTLALSLLPLEPSTFGHSARVADSGRRSSGRSRRPAAKVRAGDAEEDDAPRPLAISNVSAIAAVAAREIKEKVATPRKRRGGPKRRRKEDGDATYPATKRNTRNGRGMAQDGSPSSETAALPLESNTGAFQERRTRAWNNLKRRDSSASESSGTRGVSKNDTFEPVEEVL